MKKLGLAAIALVLMASVVSAYELPRHPMTGEMVPPPFGDVPGGGHIAIHNYDWVPYAIEIHPHTFRIVIHHADEGLRGRGVILPPGARVYIPSPQHVWSMEGNNGRSLSVGVRHGRNVDVDLVPDGDNRMVGLEAIAKDHSHQESQLLVAWAPRSSGGYPQGPAPTPYPIPVIGQDPPSQPYPVPVIGRDPPPPPHIPVIGVDPPPYIPQGQDHPYYVPYVRH